MEQHKKRVARLSEQLKQAYAHGQKVRIFHGGTNSTRVSDTSEHYMLDTTKLSHVIEVNETDRYVLVEPSVELDALVDETLKYGLIPPVVMEFPGISVGGGIQGGAAESSSFKYGVFHESALEYEILLGNGELCKTSRRQCPDLFWGTACSYGSLGVITLVKLQLIPAMPYVKLTYTHASSDKQALALIDTAVHDTKIDFIDGILFSKDHGVIMTGVFASHANSRAVHFTSSQDEWFYLHAQKVSISHEAYDEYIPIRDYLFRYDRGAFWAGRLGFGYLKLPFTKFMRRLLDPMMHTRYLYQVLHRTNVSQRFFVQDIFMPKDAIPAFLSYIERTLAIWPLWVLPMRASYEPLDRFGLSFKDTEYIVNIGIWGKTNAKSFEAFRQLNRRVEDKALTFKARKTLYAHSYYPKETFWKIYDRPHYEVLRKKYHAEEVFDDIYDKVTVTNEYKLSLSRAFIHHFFGGSK